MKGSVDRGKKVTRDKTEKTSKKDHRAAKRPIELSALQKSTLPLTKRSKTEN